MMEKKKRKRKEGDARTAMEIHMEWYKTFWRRLSPPPGRACRASCEAPHHAQWSPTLFRFPDGRC